jgi:glyoxylase-like metal-dependent hydrolase (beta-lactamase superfamily II)
MIRARVLLALLVIGTVGVFAQTPAPPATAHRFQLVQPGVYAAIGTGSMNVGSNSAIIVSDTDALIVDSHISPESARALIQDMRTITDKPVRFLVNTHFHFDHANGNQVFPAPVDIIGHEYTRRKLTGDAVLKVGLFANILRDLPGQLSGLKTRVDAEQDPAAKAKMVQQLKVQQAYSEALKELKVTPPTVTLHDRMTIVRGGREIQLLHLGRAHTAGDVLVYLPKERLLCTGDVVTSGIPNMSDGYVNDWVDTLERIKQLDFVDVIPGHGEPFKGKERMTDLQAYMRDLWQQGTALRKQGVSAEEAARRIDMTAHKGRYPNISGPGIPPIAAARLYEVIDGRAD